MKTNDVNKYCSRLIPILDGVKVESTYALRLTPYDKYGSTQIELFLKECFTDYIFVREESKKNKEHFHAVIFTDKVEENVRENIREFLSKYFPGPPKRGDANKQYNLSEIDDLEAAIIYILKDGGEIYFSSHINKDYVSQLNKKSYKKYTKEEFMTALEELKKEFKAVDYPIGEMMERVVKLKALYRQPVNLNYIYQMCISFDVHNRPDRASSYVTDFLSRYK